MIDPLIKVWDFVLAIISVLPLPIQLFLSLALGITLVMGIIKIIWEIR